MRFLRTVLICGTTPYRIYRGRVSEMAEHEGWTEFTARRILIREDLRGKLREDVLHHELRHAYWHVSGLAAYFAEVTGLTGKKLAKAEETFIRLDTPASISTFRAAGLLRGKAPAS